jgi:Tfp pilus assembly protein PilF
MEALDQPFKPEDFSSHRIPLPEVMAASSILDRPLSPHEFDRAASYRPLPPVSPLDQPISPDDFTPGPSPRPKLLDPLSEPFWPEDFADAGSADVRTKGFSFGRSAAPDGRAQQAPPRPAPAQREGPAAASRRDPPTRGGATAAAPAAPPLPRAAEELPPTAARSPARTATRAGVGPPKPPPAPPPRPQPDMGDAGDLFAMNAGEPASGHTDRLLVPREARKVSRKEPRKKGVPWALFVVLPLIVAVVVGAVFGIMALLDRRTTIRLRAEASDAMASGNYAGYVKAARTYRDLVDKHPSDADLLATAARIAAMTALGFGTDDDRAAEALIPRAAEAGASEHDLAAARAALHLFRGNLPEADKVLTGAGEDDIELIYLRGLWQLRQDNVLDAWRQFAAAAKNDPNDVRMALALARVDYLQERPTDALQKLAEVVRLSPQNVEARLLEAMTDLDDGRDPAKADLAARAVLGELSSEASPGQLAWARLLRAQSLESSAAELESGGRAAKRREARDEALAALKSPPARDAEFRALLSATLLALGDAKAAREQAEQAVELSRNLSRHRLLLAETLLQEGDLTRAEENLRAAGASPKASLVLGRILFERGDYLSAAQRFEEASVGEREAPQAKLYRARCMLRLGRTREAIDLLDRLADGDPPVPQAWTLLGEAYLTTSEPAQAEEALRKAAHALPADPQVAVNLAELYAYRGEHDQAVKVVRAVLDREPELVEALVTQGGLMLDEGRPDAAAEAYERALKIRPADGAALVGRARAASAERDFPAAERFLSKAAARAAPALFNMAEGELALSAYRPADAVERLEKALAASPGHPVASTLLADALLLLGDETSLSRAARLYRDVLKVRPADPAATVGRAEAELLRGNISAVKGLLVQAEKAVAARESTSKHVKARLLSASGRFAYDMGDSALASETLGKAVELDDSLAEAHLTLALAHEERNRSGDACAQFRAYLRLAEHGPRVDVAEARRGERDNCR